MVLAVMAPDFGFPRERGHGVYRPKKFTVRVGPAWDGSWRSWACCWASASRCSSLGGVRRGPRRRDAVRRQELGDRRTEPAAGTPCRPRPGLDRPIAARSGFRGEDVPDRRVASLPWQRERRPRGSLVREELVDALHVPARQPVLDVEIQPDQRLRAPDRLSASTDVCTAYASTTC
jgi:hypothetical protein